MSSSRSTGHGRGGLSATRCCVEPASSITSRVDQTEMGKPATLTEFLSWSLQWYPAEHYFLVLWGHAYGLGFGRDHDDPLTLDELKIALSAFFHERSQKPHRSGAHPALDFSAPTPAP